MVGGAAYHAGKTRQASRTREEEQEMRLEELEAQRQAPPAYAPPAAPPPAAPGGITDDKIAQLTKLGQLRDSGVLTAEEFDEQKRRLLAS
jgi:putative oligomerization/nucleic acid binding protein